VSLIVAAQVAVSGIVAWVGLVVPHSAGMLVGPDPRRLLPTAAFLGALFVLAWTISAGPICIWVQTCFAPR